MKIPFDIKYRDKIESGEYKVETRDGRPVRIVCYDRKYGYPIMALATEADGHEIYVNCNFDGRESRIYEWPADLFIVTPEPEQSEDERIRKEIVGFIDNVLKDKNVLLLVADRIGDNIPSMIPDWIAYLERQKEQKSIEDVIKNITKNKEAATKFLKSAGIMDDNGELAEMYRSEQKSAEWSDKDESYLQTVINEMEANKKEAREYERKKYDTIILWLKSLRPQPHWKPSEEQIKAIDLAIRFVTDDFDEHPTLSETLRGLYNDLKNL